MESSTNGSRMFLGEVSKGKSLAPLALSLPWPHPQSQCRATDTA